jgi:hypothetical protein
VLLRALLVALGVAPFVPALAPLGGLSHALEAWFAFQCERDPSRMLAVGAVCARCLGLYVGLGLGALVARPRLAYPRLELALGGAVALLLLDVASESFDWRGPSGPLRLFTGLALGYLAGVLVVVRLGAASEAVEVAD